MDRPTADLAAAQHLPHEALPAALADLHRATAVGATIVLTLVAGSGALGPDDLVDVVTGAGFDVTTVDVEDRELGRLRITAVRARTLADHVGPGMRLLLCGLNPSIYSADRGVNYARPGNRFWPALLAAGLATADRDPADALRRHGVGMTDLVKRATVAASELTPDEYEAGVARVERLCAWLRPGTLCMVGLAGWRAAVDRTATTGWQPAPLGGVPVYVMPSTSGLNASTQHAGFVAHLLAAARGPEGPATGSGT
jgi:TDG/mug DNA glycosylase family protein